MEVKPGIWEPEKCPFPLNRNVPSMEATDTKITLNVNKFPGPNFVSLNGGFPKEEVLLYQLT